MKTVVSRLLPALVCAMLAVGLLHGTIFGAPAQPGVTDVPGTQAAPAAVTSPAVSSPGQTAQNGCTPVAPGVLAYSCGPLQSGNGQPTFYYRPDFSAGLPQIPSSTQAYFIVQEPGAPYQIPASSGGQASTDNCWALGLLPQSTAGRGPGQRANPAASPATNPAASPPANLLQGEVVFVPSGYISGAITHGGVAPNLPQSIVPETSQTGATQTAQGGCGSGPPPPAPQANQAGQTGSTAPTAPPSPPASPAQSTQIGQTGSTTPTPSPPATTA